MENKKEIIKIIENKFANMMLNFGFNKKFSKSHLKRKTEYGCDIIHFIYKDYYDSLELLIDVGLRYDKIMKYISNILKEPGYISIDQNSTLLGHYLHVLSGKESRWEIKTIEEIDNVIKEVYVDIVEYVFPFFEKYSNVTEVYNLSLDDSKQYNLMPIDNYRAINSIAISKIYNIDNLNELIKDRKRYLDSLSIDNSIQKEFMLKVFDYFVSRVKEEK